MSARAREASGAPNRARHGTHRPWRAGLGANQAEPSGPGAHAEGNDLFSDATALAREDPPPFLESYVEALNAMIDVHGKRV